MLKTIKTAVILAMAWLAMSAWADSAAEQLVDLLGKLQTVEAQFAQTTFDQKGAVKQKSQGLMAWQRPGKFRWVIEEPTEQVIIADGKYLWVYDADLAQVTRKKQAPTDVGTPALLLSGSLAKLTTQFNISRLQQNSAHTAWFQLVPRQQDNVGFTSIQIGFANGLLTEMRLNSNLGPSSVLKFYNMTLNNTLSAELFQFSPPVGVDVIAE